MYRETCLSDDRLSRDMCVEISAGLSGCACWNRGVEPILVDKSVNKLDLAAAGVLKGGSFVIVMGVSKPLTGTNASTTALSSDTGR